MPAWLAWTAIKALLSGWLGKAWSFLCHRSFWQLTTMAAVALFMVQHFELAHERKNAAAYQAQAVNYKRQIETDRAAYAKAQADAAALNKVQVQRVEQQQKDISDASISHLSARLQLIADELRKQQNSTIASAPRGPATGDASTAPCRAYDPAWMCLSPADRLRAAQNEERHDELIDWNLKQASLDPNTP